MGRAFVNNFTNFAYVPSSIETTLPFFTKKSILVLGFYCGCACHFPIICKLFIMYIKRCHFMEV